MRVPCWRTADSDSARCCVPADLAIGSPGALPGVVARGSGLNRVALIFRASHLGGRLQSPATQQRRLLSIRAALPNTIRAWSALRSETRSCDYAKPGTDLATTAARHHRRPTLPATVRSPKCQQFPRFGASCPGADSSHPRRINPLRQSPTCGRRGPRREAGSPNPYLRCPRVFARARSRRHRRALPPCSLHAGRAPSYPGPPCR